MYLLYEKFRQGRHDEPVEYPIAVFESAEDAIAEAKKRNQARGPRWYYADSSNLPLFAKTEYGGY